MSLLAFGIRPSYKAVGGGGDPNFSNVSLLLHMEGANASTTFIDSSNNAFSVTANGNAQISSTSTKFGIGTALLDGSGDFLTWPSDTAFDIGTGDFTLEMFVRPSATISRVENLWVGSVSSATGLYVTAAGKIAWWVDGIGNIITGTTTLAANTWYYVAAKRESGTLSLHLGTSGSTTSEGSTSNTSSYNFSSFALGKGGFNNTWTGRMDEVRLTKGVARNVSTVPTVAFPNSVDGTDPSFANVELLLHCDGTNGSTTFTDSSSPAKTITAFGNAQISTTTPKFGTGKGLFDGSGDYLEVSSSADFEFGTGLFTVDLWLNTTQGTGFHQPIGQFFASPLDGEWSLRPKNQGGSGGGIGIAYRTSSGFVDANSGFDVNDGNWHFIRLVRESSTVLRLYVDGTMRVNHTISASQSLGRTGRGLRLGRNENDANAYYNGSIDEVRITKGIARPGSEVPTAAFPDS